MGRIAKILSFAKRKVVADPGGGANVTASHFSSPGDDSQPLQGDLCFVPKSPKSGGGVSAGYYDTTNKSKAGPGDKRIYARDSNGAVVVEIWLKSDGSCEILNDTASVILAPDGGLKADNGSGSFELQPSGVFVVNGVTIDTAGNITTPATVAAATLGASTSLTVAGTEMAGHNHAQAADSNGDTQQPTGPPA